MFNVNLIVFKDFIKTFKGSFIHNDQLFFSFYCGELAVNVSVEFDADLGVYTADIDTEYDGALHTAAHMVQAESTKECIKLIKATAKEIYKAI